jgi:predicted short-subunit dehydrogenase-like oxidoreductase (DUF2520 family)
MVSSEKIPLLVGSGRLARHLGFYLKNTYTPFLTWSRKTSLPLDKALQDTDLVLLAISDDALSPFYDEYLKNFKGLVVHFSGANSDPRMKSCHPLMSFTQELLPEALYPQIAFAESETGIFKQIFPQWKNPTFVIRPKDRALYHACAVLMASGTQSLWLRTLEQMNSLGVPNDALVPYLNRITLQFFKQNQSAMTGPWVRGDKNTIEAHLQALKKTDLLALYQELMKGHYESN